jgi:hypothetical protein
MQQHDDKRPLDEVRRDIIAAAAVIIVLLMGGLISMEMIDIFNK